MIIITGPTGQIGGQLLEHLLAGDEPIRVIVRDQRKLPRQVAERVEIVTGSYADPEVVMKAFAGADAVFWVPIAVPTAPSVEAAFLDLTRPACEAIRRHGVKHVISVSALGRGWPKPAGHATASIRMDDLLAASGANFRALACPSLMDNLLRQAALIRDRSMFCLPVAGDHRTPQLATRDVAAVAARLLRERSWTGARDLPMLGPEDISCNEQARIISQVLGRPVSFQEMSMADMKSLMLQRGASEAMAQAMIDMAMAKNEGLDQMIPRSPQNSTPTRFQAWCEEVLRPAL